MQVVFIGGVNGEFGGGQLEDQPAAVDVDVLELQDVFDESPIGIGVSGVDDDVCAVDHR